MRSAASLFCAFLALPSFLGAVVDFSQASAGTAPVSPTASAVSPAARAAAPTQAPTASATPPAAAPTMSAWEREAYRKAERAGGILDDEDSPADGKVVAGTDGGVLYANGQEVHLLLQDASTSRVGDEFLAVREVEQVQGLDPKGLVGSLMQSQAVVRVTAVDGPRLKGRVVRTFLPLEPGDKIRSRKQEAALFVRGLPGNEKGVSGLSGAVLTVQGATLAAVGGVVYLDLGRNQGVRTGMRFQGPEGSRLQVISVRARTCAARVLAAKMPLARGDKVHSKG